MTKRTLVSFCSFEGEIKVIHIRPIKTKSSQKHRVRILDVGLFDGIRKEASAEFTDVPEEMDQLLTKLRQGSPTCRRMIDSAISTFVTVNFREMYNVVRQCLDKDALKEWKHAFEKEKKREKEQVIYELPKEWAEDSEDVCDLITQGFQSICNSHEQFGDLRLTSWRFPREIMMKRESRDIIEICRSIVHEDKSICKRLKTMCVFMKMYFKSRGEKNVAILLEAMRRKCSVKYDGARNWTRFRKSSMR